jgi:hypothetical protein
VILLHSDAFFCPGSLNMNSTSRDDTSRQTACGVDFSWQSSARMFPASSCSPALHLNSQCPDFSDTLKELGLTGQDLPE